MRNVVKILAGLSLWLLTSSAQPSGSADVASQLREIAAAGQLPELRWPDFSDYRGHVRNFYEPAGYTPAWIRDGQPSPQALAIVDLLKQRTRNLRPSAHSLPDALHLRLSYRKSQSRTLQIRTQSRS